MFCESHTRDALSSVVQDSEDFEEIEHVDEADEVDELDDLNLVESVFYGYENLFHPGGATYYLEWDDPILHIEINKFGEPYLRVTEFEFEEWIETHRALYDELKAS